MAGARGGSGVLGDPLHGGEGHREQLGWGEAAEEAGGDEERCGGELEEVQGHGGESERG